MKSIDYLLIGGGLACEKAAQQIREHDRRGRVLIVGEEAHLPYNRPPLSKELVRGEVKPREIRLSSRLSYLRRRVGVLRSCTVDRLQLDVNSGTRYPHFAELSNGKEVRFRKALIATGGRPRRLEGVPGSDLANVLVLRSIDNAQRIASHAGAGKEVVVVGAGFIGVELAASLSQLGCTVTVVEQEERVWPSFAPEQLSSFMRSRLEEKGIAVRTGESVRAFHGSTALSSVELSSGEQLHADFACLACGIAPRLDLAEQAGLDVDDGLVVDEQLRSSHHDIYGAGDIARFRDPYFDVWRRVEHYGQAEYTGLLTGANMSGEERSYDLLTYVWSDVFDLHVEAAGLDREYDSVIVRGSFEDRKALLLLMRGGRLLGYVGVNASEADFGPLQLLIKRGADLSEAGETLGDPSKPLAPLLESA